MPATATQPSGRISADEIWTLDAVKAHLGLGASALRQARRQGLRVKYIGRRGYICGRDLIDFISTTARDEK